MRRLYASGDDQPCRTVCTPHGFAGAAVPSGSSAATSTPTVNWVTWPPGNTAKISPVSFPRSTVFDLPGATVTGKSSTPQDICIGTDGASGSVAVPEPLNDAVMVYRLPLVTVTLGHS